MAVKEKIEDTEVRDKKLKHWCYIHMKIRGIQNEV